MASGYWPGSSPSSHWSNVRGHGPSYFPSHAPGGYGHGSGMFGIQSGATSGPYSGSSPWSSQSRFSSTSNSSSSKGQKDKMSKHGSEWTYLLYFDPRADKKDNDIEEIEDEDLIDELDDLVDLSEEIISVYAYKSALSDYQLTKILLFHVFIVFETDNWWWSIEKNTKGITLQRARKKTPVKEKHLKETRTQVDRIELIEKDSTKKRKTIKKLIKKLRDEDELNEEYDVVLSNCKHFGKKYFEFLSKKKELQYNKLYHELY